MNKHAEDDEIVDRNLPALVGEERLILAQANECGARQHPRAVSEIQIVQTVQPT